MFNNQCNKNKENNKSKINFDALLRLQPHHIKSMAFYDDFGCMHCAIVSRDLMSVSSVCGFKMQIR